MLSAIFTAALNDQITLLHPCHGSEDTRDRTQAAPDHHPDQFATIHASLPTRDLQLLVETDVETGLRWGELIEFRVKDVDFDTGVITVSRVAWSAAKSGTPASKQPT